MNAAHEEDMGGGLFIAGEGGAVRVRHHIYILSRPLGGDVEERCDFMVARMRTWMRPWMKTWMRTWIR